MTNLINIEPCEKRSTAYICSRGHAYTIKKKTYFLIDAPSLETFKPQNHTISQKSLFDKILMIEVSKDVVSKMFEGCLMILRFGQFGGHQRCFKN